MDTSLNEDVDNSYAILIIILFEECLFFNGTTVVSRIRIRVDHEKCQCFPHAGVSPTYNEASY